MSDDRTWLVSVLFLDIVGCSIIPVNQQLKVKRHFQDLVSNELAQLENEHTIRLDTGDGMAICYMGDPERVYPIAKTLRAYFSATDNDEDLNYKVRMGLNFGPVKLIDDLNNERNCIGAGINDAERVMSFASDDQLFVSRSYFEVVNKMSRDYANELSHVGLRADKHNQEHDVYELIMDALQGMSAAPSLTSSASSTGDGSSKQFNADEIERVSKEFCKYIKRDEAEKIIQDSMQRSGSIKEVCFHLSNAISSEDDRYDFNEYLKYYGYAGYSK